MSKQILTGKNVFYLFVLLMAIIFFKPLMYIGIVAFISLVIFIFLREGEIIGKKKD